MSTPSLTADVVAPVSSGVVRDGVHYLPVRVYYEDTDAGGIVYHANYLRFAERARTEMLRVFGFGQDGLRARDGLAFAVRRCTIDYRHAARLDDALVVATRVQAVGGASLDIEQIIRRGGETIARLDVVVACIGPTLRPARLPAALRSALATLSTETVQENAR